MNSSVVSKITIQDKGLIIHLTEEDFGIIVHSLHLPKKSGDLYHLLRTFNCKTVTELQDEITGSTISYVIENENHVRIDDCENLFSITERTDLLESESTEIPKQLDEVAYYSTHTDVSSIIFGGEVSNIVNLSVEDELINCTVEHVYYDDTFNVYCPRLGNTRIENLVDFCGEGDIEIPVILSHVEDNTWIPERFKLFEGAEWVVYEKKGLELALLLLSGVCCILFLLVFLLF